MDKFSLLRADRAELEEFLGREGLSPYRARQLLHWIYEKGATRIEDITEFSKSLRERLSERAYIGGLTLLGRQTSADGTEKFLFGLEDGNSIESVLIPDAGRLTLCVSSQAGCPMGCSFCLTGGIGFRRDLMPHEIAGQFLSARGLAAPRKITNIVFMGMGEPLNNLWNVAEAINRLAAYARFPRRRITVSTCGIVPMIPELARLAPKVKLAVSLNAPTDEVRSGIMPVNRRYGLKALIAALKKYPLAPRERITLEYVLLGGLNDSDMDARRLSALLKGLPCKVNLIPYNAHAGSALKAPGGERVLSFQKVLSGRGFTAIVRKSKGTDILAACGQLKADYDRKGTAV